MIVPYVLKGVGVGGGTGSGSDPDTPIDANAIAQRVWSYQIEGVQAQAQLLGLYDMFANNATIELEGDGSKVVTIFQDDGATVLRRVRISPDGLTRTQIA